MTNYFISIFLFLSLLISAQKNEEVKPVDISNILSYEEFQEIKEFVLNKGQTMTYCNMYSSNPFYKFQGNIELFLNPVVQFPDRKSLNNPDTYDTIIIRMTVGTEDYPFMYTDIKENRDKKKIFLSPYYDTEETMSLIKREIAKYITNILEEIEQEKQVQQAAN